MGREMTVSDSIVVNVAAARIYAQIADPSQMPRWSPENTGAEVPAAGSPLSVGDSFVGSNKRGRARWSTRCTVVAAEPGRRFAFDVLQIGLRRPLINGSIATWDYTFEPVEDGTRVTETWTDRRKHWPDALANAFDKLATGGNTFAAFQRKNIARTLARLKADLEATPAS